MKKITKDEVMDYILGQTNDVLVELNDLIKDCFKKQSSKLRVTLLPGDMVRIKGSAKSESGEVTKVNRTRAVVKCWNNDVQAPISYNVPFTMLTKINKGGTK